MIEIKFNRRSIRLKDWDYASEGAYYVTICTYKMMNIFGIVEDETTKLNKMGEIVEEKWLRTAELRKNVVLDQFIIMPNHLHGIIMILENLGRGELTFTPNKKLHSPTQTLGSIIRGFKSVTTKRVNIIRNTFGFPLWQRNYYERIIRNESELNKFREYIFYNPVKWSFKREFPVNID